MVLYVVSDSLSIIRVSACREGGELRDLELFLVCSWIWSHVSLGVYSMYAKNIWPYVPLLSSFVACCVHNVPPVFTNSSLPPGRCEAYI